MSHDGHVIIAQVHVYIDLQAQDHSRVCSIHLKSRCSAAKSYFMHAPITLVIYIATRADCCKEALALRSWLEQLIDSYLLE